MWIGLLGDVQVRVDGRDVPLGPRQRRLVFAVLAWEVNRVVPLDRLVDLVWPQSPPLRAAHAIQVGVSDLRNRLAGLGVAVETHGAGYLLRADPLLIDVHRFADLVTRSGGLADDVRRVALLDEALQLWRGPALADTADEATRQRLCAGVAETRLAAIEDRAAVRLRLGRHDEVVAELAELVRENPERERMVRQLAVALTRSGRSDEALDVLRRSRTWLADELGLDPGTEFQQLEAELRLPFMLPPSVGFTGRATHIGDLDAATGAGEESLAVRIGAIVGTAGVGKTALASHWAQLRRNRFPDGQLYLDMRGYSSDPPLTAEQALTRFLRVLGVPPTEMPADLAEATGMFRTRLRGKRMLVVLDNVAGVDQVRPLIPGDPGCVVVVTSRDRLDGLVALDGAIRVSLDVLTADESAELLRTMLGDRADPELARACAHLPLALRMAAAHLANHPDRTVADYVRELRGLSDTVRSAFALSYGALKPESQRMFRLLGLLPGPDVTVASAAALADCPPLEAARLLDQLASAHLVTQHVHGRYFLHDLLSRYAEEQCAVEEGTPALDRLMRHYVQVVNDAADVLYPYMLRLPQHERSGASFTSTTALAWLDAERANLVAAAVHGPPPTSWLLADALRGYFYQCRDFTDWFAVARAGLAADDQWAQAAMHFSLGLAHQARNQYQPATEHYRASLWLSEALGWGSGEASAFINLGLIDEVRGDLRQAAEQYAEGYQRSSRVGARQLEATTLVNLAAVQEQLGQLLDAESRLAAALEINRELGSRHGEADTRYYLGSIAAYRGRFSLAEEQVTAALTYYREIGRIHDEADTLALRSRIRCAAGRLAESLVDARAAVALAVQAADQHTQCAARIALANALRASGDPDSAASEFSQALALADSVDAGYLRCLALIGASETCHDLGQHSPAAVHAAQARDIAVAAGYRLLEGMALAASQADLAAAAIFAETGYQLG